MAGENGRGGTRDLSSTVSSEQRTVARPGAGSFVVKEERVLVAGTRTGRTSPEETTLYKSVGVAVQDATAATLVLAAARRQGVGRDLSL